MDIYYPNYPFNDLSDDVFLSSDKAHKEDRHRDSSLITKQKYDQNRVRFTFHSPETHFTKPILGNILKYEAEVHGKARGFFNRSNYFAKQTLLSEKHYNIAAAYAFYISRNISSPTDEIVAQFASTIGNAGGAAVGAVAGGAASLIPGLSTIAGPISKVGGVIGGFIGSMVGSNIAKNFLSLSVFTEAAYLSSFEKMLNLFKAATNAVEYNYQHQSVGKYNEINTSVPRANVNLTATKYIEEGKQTIRDGNTEILFNNRDRESSVYLHTETLRPNYSIADNSRTLLSDGTFYSAVNPTNITNENPIKSIYYAPMDCNYRVNWIDCAGQSFSTFIDRDDTGRVLNCVLQVISYINAGSDNFCRTDFDKNPPYHVVNPTPEFLQRISSIHVVQNCAAICGVSTANSITEYPCTCNKPTERNISSFYVSNKTNLVNQYGSIYDIKWVPMTNPIAGVDINTKNDNMYFGGDTFISRFSLKRKHNFFIRDTHKLSTDTGFNYSLVPNVAHPIYFYDTVYYANNSSIAFNFTNGFPLGRSTQSSILKPVVSALNILTTMTVFNVNNYKTPYYKLDCYNGVNDLNNVDASKRFSSNSLQGLMYNYVYGIPYFLTESSINLDFREDNNAENPWDRFYPKESNLEDWLQQSLIPIQTDNTYHYDRSFSQHVEADFNYIYDNNFRGLESCKTEHPQRVIYSPQTVEQEDSNNYDPYLIQRGLDFYNFSKEDGKLISIDDLENTRILARFENTSRIFASQIRLNTDINTVLLSSGTIFGSPQEFSNADNGYFGSQHRAIINTPFGHVSIDAKRGHVFLLGNGGEGLQEISNQGLRHWFNENLPFTINRSITNVDIDDAVNGVGLIMGYDYKFEQFFITKLDYEPKVSGITHNLRTKEYLFQGNVIKLTDTKYFRNKSWTISYSFYRKEWVSFHSFHPLYYIPQIETFLTGDPRGTGNYIHNVTNKSYQTFFNRLHPFIVETMSKAKLDYEVVKSVTYHADFIKYYNNYDYYYDLEQRFNKAYVYGKYHNSGELKLVKQSDNYEDRLSYPKQIGDITEIQEVQKEQRHSFNEFRNRIVTDYKHQPHWLLDSNNVNKRINLQILSFNYGINNDFIRDSNIRVRLIQDIDSRYKIIFKGVSLNNLDSYR